MNKSTPPKSNDAVTIHWSQGERVAGRLDDGAAVDDRERALHAEAQAIEHGGEVPELDQLAVDRRLAVHRVGPSRPARCRRQVHCWFARKPRVDHRATDTLGPPPGGVGLTALLPACCHESDTQACVRFLGPPGPRLAECLIPL